MLVLFKGEWEMEGLQTVGILLLVCSSLRLLHFLGLIDFAAEGKISGIPKTYSTLLFIVFYFFVLLTG